MYFDETYRQWILNSLDEMGFGETIKEELIYMGKDTILAGTVMVFFWYGKPYLMFQTLQDLALSSVRNTTLLYYEKGSIVLLGGGEFDREFVPTLRFRDCRFPTKKEFEYYERRATI